jgi:heme/copper-type cytochrome/quinol oxidase subunit 1
MTFFAVNLTFFPQHFLGLAGMPRRYADYPDCFIAYNKIRSLGSILTVLSVILFLVILWEALITRRPVVAIKIHNSNLEFISTLPIKYHTHNKPPKIFYPYKG